jgi:hypothetical protein
VNHWSSQKVNSQSASRQYESAAVKVRDDSSAHLTTSALTEASVRLGSLRRRMTSGPMSPPAAMPLHTMSAAKLEGAHTHSRAAGAARRSNCSRGRGGKSRSDRALSAALL